ncbi:spr1630 family ClpXP-sensitive toxin [Oceanobacillus neutriphilus]|uniref:Uncharacterized protein n=1 Tax=Oceanobacillus neutriphilus TaxID=531815 RepID=A0ABQ2NSS5_9BACI|nr:hypothetical protein [Oceanobacillus neutriphilus]GGP10172.1 hypothetical protein GCM10011346_17210 [Oceanobacillus neutriphilus]
MDQYKFDSSDSKFIVEAIVEGYRDYVDHRKERHHNMKISFAFAWTKGNFIESRLAENSDRVHLTYRRAKAGLTWDYLQFINGDTKKLFLIKNAAYFNKDRFSQAILPGNMNHKRPQRTYLHELSKINEHLDFIDTSKNANSSNEMSEQLSLFITDMQVQNELTDLQASYNEFHILTYSIDDAYQISEIMHYLPNPDDNKAYLIEDLSDYISGSELTDEERDIIAPEQDNDIINPEEFDIGILEEEQE